MTVIDFHTHIFPPSVRDDRDRYAARDAWFGSLYATPRAKLATAEDLVAEMDAAGVEASVACAFGWADPGLCHDHNNYILAAARAYPGRILPFVVANARHGAAAATEVARCHQLGAVGVGELMPDGQGFALDDPAALAPLVEVVTRLGLPLLTHTSEPAGHSYPGKGTVTPLAVYSFAQRYPAVTLICAHWGGGLPFYELMPELRRTLANVYYDTAAGLYLYRDDIFAAAVAAAGAAKVLFATDYPLLGQARYLARVRACGLADTALAAVLGGNAARLLRRGSGE